MVTDELWTGILITEYNLVAEITHYMRVNVSVSGWTPSHCREPSLVAQRQGHLCTRIYPQLIWKWVLCG